MINLEVGLLLANVVVYSTLLAGLIQARRRARRGAATLDAAFRQLEVVLQKRFPDLPEGHTLREALFRAKSLEPDVRWEPIERSLRDYEEHRYGDRMVSQVPDPELTKLTNELRGSW